MCDAKGRETLHAATHGSTSCSYHIISLKKRTKKETVPLIVAGTKLNIDKKEKKKTEKYKLAIFSVHLKISSSKKKEGERKKLYEVTLM